MCNSSCIVIFLKHLKHKNEQGVIERERERYQWSKNNGEDGRCIAMATLWMCMSLKLMATGECMAACITTDDFFGPCRHSIRNTFHMITS